jgi:hypothetical protein
MLTRKFEKNKTGLGHDGQLYGMQMFVWGQLGSLGELIWGFLKKEMKIAPHKHQQREIYLFIGGRGLMSIDDRVINVEKGDAIYINPNSLHSVWNIEEEDLEFILLIFTYKFKNLMLAPIQPLLIRVKYWVKKHRGSLKNGP